MGDGCPERRHVGGGGVRLNVGTGEGVRIAGAVDGGDVDALGLEGLGDAGGAGEEIEGGGGAGGPADPREDGDEAALGADVFDHRGLTAVTADHPTMGGHGAWGPSGGRRARSRCGDRVRGEWWLGWG